MTLLLAYGVHSTHVGTTFILTKEELEKGLKEEFEKGVPPEVEERRRKKGSPTHPHAIEMKESRLIHASIKLEVAGNDGYKKLCPELQEALRKRGYELYQEVIIVLKEGALRPIYYSLIYPVKKETAEEVGSKVTLYRVKTDEETGKVINLEPIEEYHTKGELPKLMRIRKKEFIDMYESLVEEYDKDPIRQEGLQIYVDSDARKLNLEKTREYIEKSKQKYLDIEFIRSFYHKYGKMVPDSTISMLFESEGEGEAARILLQKLELDYKSAENIIEESLRKGDNAALGGLLLYREEDTGELEVDNL